MLKFFFFLFFAISHSSVFAGGECSNDPVYDRYCAKEAIVPSYQCALNHARDGIKPKCLLKASELIENCSMKQLNQCGVDENDHDDAFEVCLSKFQDDCGKIGAKYMN